MQIWVQYINKNYLEKNVWRHCVQASICYLDIDKRAYLCMCGDWGDYPGGMQKTLCNVLSKQQTTNKVAHTECVRYCHVTGGC